MYRSKLFADEPPQGKVDLLVSVQWLAEHLGDPDLVVLDTTVLVQQDENGKFSSASAHSEYQAGHIPTAAYADLLGALSVQKQFNGILSCHHLSSSGMRMGKLGVGNDSRVVLYSANYPAWGGTTLVDVTLGQVLTR